HFGVETLEAYGCAGKPFAIRAAGALLQYLAETQVGSLKQIVDLVTYSTERYMSLDGQTRRNLELSESSRGERRHSLIAVLDQTRSPMGARMMRGWVGVSLLDFCVMQDRQVVFLFFVYWALVRAGLRVELGHVSDLERLINRVVNGAAGPRELLS